MALPNRGGPFFDTRAIGLGACGLILLFLAFAADFGPGPEGGAGAVALGMDGDAGTALAVGGLACFGAAVARALGKKRLRAAERLHPNSARDAAAQAETRRHLDELIAAEARPTPHDPHGTGG
jgi:hypothetical protein